MVENEVTDETLAKQLKTRLLEQDKLLEAFQNSPPTDLQLDAEVDPAYLEQAEFRADVSNFYIRHNSSGIIQRVSTLTGPRAFKRIVESWIDEINATRSRS